MPRLTLEELDALSDEQRTALREDIRRKAKSGNRAQLRKAAATARSLEEFDSITVGEKPMPEEEPPEPSKVFDIIYDPHDREHVYVVHGPDDRFPETHSSISTLWNLTKRVPFANRNLMDATPVGGPFAALGAVISGESLFPRSWTKGQMTLEDARKSFRPKLLGALSGGATHDLPEWHEETYQRISGDLLSSRDAERELEEYRKFLKQRFEDEDLAWSVAGKDIADIPERVTRMSEEEKENLKRLEQAVLNAPLRGGRNDSPFTLDRDILQSIPATGSTGDPDRDLMLVAAEKASGRHPLSRGDVYQGLMDTMDTVIFGTNPVAWAGGAALGMLGGWGAGSAARALDAPEVVEDVAELAGGLVGFGVGTRLGPAVVGDIATGIKHIPSNRRLATALRKGKQPGMIPIEELVAMAAEELPVRSPKATPKLLEYRKPTRFHGGEAPPIDAKALPPVQKQLKAPNRFSVDPEGVSRDLHAWANLKLVEGKSPVGAAIESVVESIKAAPKPKPKPKAKAEIKLKTKKPLKTKEEPKPAEPEPVAEEVQGEIEFPDEARTKIEAVVEQIENEARATLEPQGKQGLEEMLGLIRKRPKPEPPKPTKAPKKAQEKAQGKAQEKAPEPKTDTAKLEQELSDLAEDRRQAVIRRNEAADFQDDAGYDRADAEFNRIQGRMDALERQIDNPGDPHIDHGGLWFSTKEILDLHRDLQGKVARGETAVSEWWVKHLTRPAAGAVKATLGKLPGAKGGAEFLRRHFAPLSAKFGGDVELISGIREQIYMPEYLRQVIGEEFRPTRKWTTFKQKEAALYADAVSANDAAAMARHAKNLKPSDIEHVKRSLNTAKMLDEARFHRGLRSREVYEEFKEHGVRARIRHPKSRKEQKRVESAAKTTFDMAIGRMDSPYVSLLRPKEVGLKIWDDVVAKDPSMAGRLKLSAPGGKKSFFKFKDIEARDAFAKAARRRSRGAKKSSVERVGDALSEAEREYYGELFDYRLSFEQQIMRGFQEIARWDWLESLKKNPKWVLPEEKPAFLHGHVRETSTPPGYRQLGDGPKYGPLAGRKVLIDIFDTLKEMGRSESKFLTFEIPSYLAARGFWKQTKTILDPRSHVRQLRGNANMALMDGISPYNPGNLRWYFKFMRDAHQRSPMWEQGVKLGISKASVGEAEYGLHGSGVKGLHPKEFKGWVEKLANAESLSEFTKTLARSPLSKAAGQLWGMGDSVFRGASWYKKMYAEGLDPRTAAQRVHQFWPAPAEVGPAVAAASNTPFLGAFVRFEAEWMKGQTYIGMTKPWRLGAYYAMPAARMAYAKHYLGATQEQIDAVREQYGYWSAIRGFDEDGNPLWENDAFTSPGYDWMRKFGIGRADSPTGETRGFWEVAMDVMSTTLDSPEMTMILLGKGWDSFRERDIGYAYDTENEAQMREMGRFFGTSWMPGGRSYEMMRSMIETGTDRYGRKLHPSLTVADVFFGVLVRQFDPDAEMQKLGGTARKRMKELMSSITTTALDQSHSEEWKAGEMDKIRREMEKLAKAVAKKAAVIEKLK